MFDELFDVRATVCNILARVKVFRMCNKVLADTCCHSKAKVRVDVDLADSGLRCAAELIFWDTDRIVKLAVVVIDDLDIFRNDRGCTMKDNGEFRNLLFNLSENIEAKFRWNENAVCIARALLWLELERTVTRADGDGE